MSVHTPLKTTMVFATTAIAAVAAVTSSDKVVNNIELTSTLGFGFDPATARDTVCFTGNAAAANRREVVIRSSVSEASVRGRASSANEVFCASGFLRGDVLKVSVTDDEKKVAENVMFQIPKEPLVRAYVINKKVFFDAAACTSASSPYSVRVTCTTDTTKFSQDYNIRGERAISVESCTLDTSVDTTVKVQYSCGWTGTALNAYFRAGLAVRHSTSYPIPFFTAEESDSTEEVDTLRF